MAKRGFKLFALALSILVGRSFLALVEIPRTTQDRYRRASKTARSAEPPIWATYLDPIATVAGISLSDLAKQLLDAYSSARSLDKLKPLVDVRHAYEHAGLLAKKLLEGAETSHKGQIIIVPNISLPLIPVNGTEFQHLVSNVLSDVTSTGVSSIHAEPGVGKSIAVALAMLGWVERNPASITVLIRGSLKLLNDFFRVSDEAYIPTVAENLFPILSDAGVRLQLVLDNVFDKQLGERGEMLMSLARAAFKHGQVVVVTQSREVAEEVGSLNGARTRVSPQQKRNVSEYRWNQMQALKLLVNLNATAKLKDWKQSRKTRWWHKMLHAFTGTTKEPEDRVQRALNESLEAFSQDGAWVQENLDGARMHDGGWKPVDIEQFLISGIKPVFVPAVAGTTSPTQNKTVWVRQLQKAGQTLKESLPAFKITVPVIDVDDLKKAIDPSMSPMQASNMQIYSRDKDGKWQQEEEDAEVKRGATKSDSYGFVLPDASQPLS